MKLSLLSIILLLTFQLGVNLKFSAQEKTDLSIYYEELTAPQFVKAVDLSKKTCIIPMGILEKHGPHLPLGTDLIDARRIGTLAAKKEYCIIFPPYYFGQIYEAKHQPGTISYSPELIWKLLDETCIELSRNGIKKIILLNGHGGNTSFLQYFCQVQLEKEKNYSVILFSPQYNEETENQIDALTKTKFDMHAGERETSMMLSHRPDLVHLEKGKDQSGMDQKRLENLKYGYTGIWWYAKFPNHYAGDGSQADKKIGELIINNKVDQLVELIKYLKNNDTIIDLQNEFFQNSKNPLKTKQ